MKALLAVGIALASAGGFLALFGTIYSTTNYFATAQECVYGCNGTIFLPGVTSYFLYPIWSPPQYPNPSPQDTITQCGLQGERQMWYTPFNPPASCLPPPITTSANYTGNLVGTGLMLLGIIVAVRSHSSASALRHQTVDGENDRSQTSQNSATKSTYPHRTKPV